MSSKQAFRIAVMPGDGIGPEVMKAGIEVLEAAAAGDIVFDYQWLEAGAEVFRRSGSAMSKETFERAKAADAILLGAMGLPDVRYPDGTEITPQLDLRFRLDLYAGVRPVKALPGGAEILRDVRSARIDLVIVRESTEGLFASHGKGVVEDDAIARDTMVITRGVCERLFDAAFRLAQRRKDQGGKGKVTCVDKANIFSSMAFFRKIFDERAARFPTIESSYSYVDAAALDLVRKPWEFDVMVMENMYGDILSDLTSALIGGMGMAPSADIGDEYGVFQPAHGSAPDIAGQGIANPVAMIQSAAMMLDWLAERRESPPCAQVARRIDDAVAAMLANGRVRSVDLGGRDGTEAVTRAIIDALPEVTG
ncbi:isocitrate/isopropylmalate dehydrogenase family protein [Thioalkalivibrio sp. HK1]|uniref:isocitrate/isopropylmalate dehydrogenase family protein n=1 Tax=Thioalkalivibrio sp. HK1 TaxID=1469245 RepID=UPI000471001F|nr:isocitrate/isopropylmalate dehydrogenase family protein [Thioalkalivibrio sp. HK1]